MESRKRRRIERDCEGERVCYRLRERSSEQDSCKIRGIERGGECTRVKKEDKELQREHKREDECS